MWSLFYEGGDSMSWQDELDRLLSKLGVHQENTPEEITSEEESEFFFIQSSLDHPGVFYRMDLVDDVPELRVFVPTHQGALKVRIYLVRLSKHTVLGHLFALYMTTGGESSAFEEIEGKVTIHLFQVIIEATQGLFWQGNLETLQFPPEIDVQRLL
jgi:hypothetical protein